ncbi:IQ and AAA domain-containing protein 1-like [Episyrphus balteatus]|uniref:IQ and AAA domain-containing protein 1-like n=1 Tax=Episyrphus balteatus TaxID=286459 RepID=UPI00248544C7|nr:IQ and AAA domain-containing protein 1-like [Episyrphus balteatus]
MSFDYNYKFWVATQNDLDDILKRQEVYKKLKPIEDKSVTHYLFAEVYVRYVQLVNKLGYIYHHTFQVQKRDVIRQLVEASTQRLLELKNELKNIELSEFIYVDKTLIEKRLTPDDITIWTPKYFPYWRPTNVQEMIYGPRKNLDESERYEENLRQDEGITKTGITIKKARIEKDSMSKEQEDSTSLKRTEKTNARMREKIEVKIDPVKKELMDAVTLIQAHERARVARVLLTNIRYNPKVYKPKMRDDKMIKYDFTHNYYTKKKDIGTFNYYAKPISAKVKRFSEDEISAEEENDSESSLSSFDEDQELSAQEVESEIEESSSSDESKLSDFERESEIAINFEEFVENFRIRSALKIQTFWRGYRERKRYKTLLHKKAIIYGMCQNFKPKSKKIKSYLERVQEAAKHRFLKEKYDDEFIQFCEDERSRILRVRGPWIMEDISDNIRAWFREFYDKLGTFHPYPDEVKGGTLLLVRGETMNVFEYQDKLKEKILTKEQKQKIKQKAKELKKKQKEKLKKEKQAIAKRRAKLKAAGIFDLKDEMERSKSIAQIENTIEMYKKQWQDIDEKLNRNHEPIKNWITSDYYSEIHQELQLTVDELMRLEFELLQKALAKDMKKKYKAPKKKKPKAKKGKKKKVAKDLTADRSIESLFYELQDAGIVKTYPRKTFDYFIGERNHCAFDILNIQMKDTPPYQGEIKDVLMEYVLGMGPLNITKPKSICLVGPTNSGKKLLCDILATEIDAVVLDISPENTVQYQSNLKYFLHIILKMAKILQPTILFLRDVHRVFWKKIPPEFVDLCPRLLQSQLKKTILKSIKKEDKVLLLGTTDAPWTANGKMKKLFQKILLVPKTEYATNFILRRNVTLQFPAIPRDFDFSALTLVTRDYVSGDVMNNIEEVLNLRRRMELVKRPLEPMEFLENFLEKDIPEFPLELKVWEKFIKWYRKSSTMAKKRAKMIKLQEELLARQNKKSKTK